MVDKLILSGEDIFAAYSLPGEDGYQLLVQNNQQLYPLKFSSTGFAVAPFLSDSKYIPFLIKADRIYRDQTFEFTTKKNRYSKDVEKSTYLKNIKKLKSLLKNDVNQKVIISRTKTIINKKQNWFEIFDYLVKTQKDAFVFIFNTPQYGAWIGASPELFMRQRDTSMEASILAGTQPKNGVPLHKISWGEKECLEHSLVSDFVEERLDEMGVKWNKMGPSTVDASTVFHLQSSYDLNIENNITDLINQLHHSPALLGWPVLKAKNLISKFEEHERNYYCGFLGPISMKSKDLYINLRSMQCFKNKAVLFAGGGILHDSVAEKEWIETEMKMKVMESAILNA